MNFKIWKILITIVVTVIGVLILPFTSISSNSVEFNFQTDLSTLMIISVIIAASNAVFGLLTLLKNKQASLIATVFNIGFSVALVAVVPLLSTSYGSLKLPMIITSTALVSCDLVSTVTFKTIKGQQVIIKEQQSHSSVAQNNPSTIPVEDSESLKQRILMMQSGLNKNIGEAIVEMQNTGTLAGIEIGKIDDDEELNNNKIVPLTLEEIKVNAGKKAELVSTIPMGTNTETSQASSENLLTVEEHPLDLDYESIHETSLSRKKDTFDKNFPLTEEFEEWETH